MVQDRAIRLSGQVGDCPSSVKHFGGLQETGSGVSVQSVVFVFSPRSP